MNSNRLARLRLLRVGEQYRSLRASQRAIRRRLVQYVVWGHEEGMSNGEIHRLTGLSRDTIRRMIIENEKEGNR